MLDDGVGERGLGGKDEVHGLDDLLVSHGLVEEGLEGRGGTLGERVKGLVLGAKHAGKVKAPFVVGLFPLGVEENFGLEDPPHPALEAEPERGFGEEVGAFSRLAVLVDCAHLELSPEVFNELRLKGHEEVDVPWVVFEELGEFIEELDVVRALEGSLNGGRKGLEGNNFVVEVVLAVFEGDLDCRGPCEKGELGLGADGHGLKTPAGNDIPSFVLRGLGFNV